MTQTLCAAATLLLCAALAASAPQAGPDAVWPAPRHALDQLCAQCKGQAVPDVRRCLLSFMESSGAKPQAVAFARGLEGGGFLRSLEPHGPVSVAFPVRVCHACADLAHARVGYDFDGSGRFLGAKLIGVNESEGDASGKGG